MKVHFYGLLITIMILTAGCKSKEERQHRYIENTCSQYPINLFVAEQDTDHPLFIYGDRDSDFRVTMNKLWLNFNQSGYDIDADDKSKLISHFLPNYMQSCQAFFEPVLENCGQMEADSEEFRSCMKPYHQRFQAQLQLQRFQSKDELVNLDKLPLRDSKLSAQ